MTQPALDQIAPLSRRAVAYVIDALIAGGLAIVLGGDSWSPRRSPAVSRGWSESSSSAVRW